MQDDNDVAIAEARTARSRMIERLQWWELHRSNVLIPMAAVAFGAGFGVGYLLRELFGLPQPLSYLTAVAALLLSGRYVDRYFSPTKLKMLDAKIERLERKKK